MWHCGTLCGCTPPPSASDACADRDKTGNCAVWAKAGECAANPTFMKLKCAASCDTCDMLNFTKRCPPLNQTAAVAPGAMGEMFEHALSNFAEFSPQMLSSDPWVVSFEDFVQEDEIEALLRHSEGRFARSLTSSGRKDDEFVPSAADIRTSWTTWCDTDACKADAAVVRLQERMGRVARVPTNNSEFIQLLRYLPCPHAGHADCQFYKRHHDTIPELAALQCGPRVYTFFLCARIA